MDGLIKLRQSFEFFAFPDRAILGKVTQEFASLLMLKSKLT